MPRISKYDLLFIVLISSVVFVGLGSSSLRDYDEGIYAQVSRQILQNNDWLTLTFGDELWFEKPPLFMWSTAFLFKLFGVSEFWARAASATSSILVILLTYIIGSAVFERRVGLFAVVPLLTGYEFMRQARNGTTDMMLTLFIMMILAVYILYPRSKPGFWYLIAVLFSLGFLVKFWAILIVLIAIGIDLILQKQVRTVLSDKHFWGAVGVGMLIVLPWHLLMYFKHGQIFIDRYVLFDLIKRSTGALEGNTGAPRYYFDRMAYDFAPWFLLLPIAITLELRRLVGTWNRTGTLILFTGCIFGAYSLLVSTKIFHYLTPIYPMLAIFSANIIIKAYDDYRSTAFSGLVMASLVATIIPTTKTMIAFLGIALLMVVVLFTGQRLARPLKTFLENRVSTGPNVFHWIISSSSRLLTRLQSQFESIGYARVPVLLMCMFLITLGTVRSRHLYETIESPIEKIARIAGTSKILYTETILGLALPPDYSDGVAGPAAMFYSERPLYVAWSENKLRELTTDEPREIIMAESYIDLLDDTYEVSILARSSPFIYGVIEQRNQPSSAFSD